jgi:hypothetical protein
VQLFSCFLSKPFIGTLLGFVALLMIQVRMFPRKKL